MQGDTHRTQTYFLRFDSLNHALDTLLNVLHFSINLTSQGPLAQLTDVTKLLWGKCTKIRDWI